MATIYKKPIDKADNASKVIEKINSVKIDNQTNADIKSKTNK